MCVLKPSPFTLQCRCLMEGLAESLSSVSSLSNTARLVKHVYIFGISNGTGTYCQRPYLLFRGRLMKRSQNSFKEDVRLILCLLLTACCSAYFLDTVIYKFSV